MTESTRFLYPGLIEVTLHDPQLINSGRAFITSNRHGQPPSRYAVTSPGKRPQILLYSKWTILMGTIKIQPTTRLPGI